MSKTEKYQSLKDSLNAIRKWVLSQKSKKKTKKQKMQIVPKAFNPLSKVNQNNIIDVGNNDKKIFFKNLLIILLVNNIKMD